MAPFFRFEEKKNELRIHKLRTMAEGYCLIEEQGCGRRDFSFNNLLDLINRCVLG
ncbi:MAG: hypothetical protein GXO59_05020 [Dictyoglomi bacterium]|nr:hypothetical protein [Dictyoglomota bacterium]